jgi:hypothetical protein
MSISSVSTGSAAPALAERRGPTARVIDLGALFGRLERFEARRNAARGVAAAPATRGLDRELIADGEIFEAAWARELEALIALKRLNTAEARAAAKAARAATARLVARIEIARAITLDGLKVKSRAILWRRNGEPLATTAKAA